MITERNRIFQEDETGKIIAEVTFPETSPGVFVIDEIKNHGGQVKATCSYAEKWLNEHEI